MEESTLESAPTMNKTSGNNILSEKVTRALQVRTDTPAMKAALEALANLSISTSGGLSSSSVTSSGGSLDARSVRVAIERDALHQGKLLEQELDRLVDTVQTMRKSIKEVARVAKEEVEESLSQSVIVTKVDPIELNPSESNLDVPVADDGDEEETKENSFNYVGRENYVFEEEERLASLLADAFHHREEAKERFESITEFMDKFDVSASDSRLLDQYEFEDAMETQGKGMQFLDALSRVSKIRTELQNSFGGGDLSSTPGGPSQTSNASTKLGVSSAMRMMDSLSTKQERAFERLYRFLHSRLDLASANVSHVPTSSSSQAAVPQPVMEDDDGMDETLGNEFVRRSLILLRQVPAYYSHTLELIATRRRSEVTRKFLLALTSGYNGGTPIERMAHDPVNYVGDMLAFIFRMLNVESVVAKGLAVAEVEPYSAQLDDINGTVCLTAIDVLNDTLSGVSRPLKSRISQVINSLSQRQDEEDSNSTLNFSDTELIHESSVGMDDEANAARVRLASLYSISGLLLFYHSAMKKVVNKMNCSGSESDSTETMKISLVQCIFDCLEESVRAYSISIKIYSGLLDQLASFSNESTSSLAQKIVCRLCDVREASPGFGPDMASALESSPTDMSTALSLEFLCDTFLGKVVKSFTNLNDAMSARMALLTLQKAGMKLDCFQKWEGAVAQEEQIMTEDQIKSDTNLVLDECGLGFITNNIDSMKAVFIEGMTMASYPGLSPESVKEAIGQFYGSLIDPPLPTYDNIRDPSLRKYARSKVAQNVVERYKEVHDALSSDLGGYSDLSFLEYKPDQVEKLLTS